jgi:hypothetical protein
VKRINRFSHKKEKNKHVNKIERTWHATCSHPTTKNHHLTIHSTSNMLNQMMVCRRNRWRRRLHPMSKLTFFCLFLADLLVKSTEFYKINWFTKSKSAEYQWYLIKLTGFCYARDCAIKPLSTQTHPNRGPCQWKRGRDATSLLLVGCCVKKILLGLLDILLRPVWHCTYPAHLLRFLCPDETNNWTGSDPIVK